MASRLVPGQISWTCAGPDPFTTAAHCVWGNVHWNPRRPRPSPVSGWWKTRYHTEFTLWQPWMQTAFTVRQAVSDTRPDVRAALTLQGVWRANVRLEKRGGGRTQSTGVTQTRRRDKLCLEEMTIASWWSLYCSRHVKTPASALLAYSGEKGLWDIRSPQGEGVPGNQYPSWIHSS